jgi:hypothetical protein
VDYFRLATKWLPRLGWVLFLSSLVLPAAEIHMFQRPTIVHGWQASLLALASINMLFSDPLWAALPLASLGNVLVIVAPWLMKPVRKKSTLVASVLGLAFCVVCALAAPHLLAKFNPALHIGYYLWIAAMLMSLTAALIRLAQVCAKPSSTNDQAPLTDRDMEIR